MGATYGSPQDERLAGFKDWADETYEIGYDDQPDDIVNYGDIVSIQRSIESAGSLIEGAHETLEVGFADLWDDAIEALRQYGLSEIANLLTTVHAEFDEHDMYADPTVADERRRAALDARWVDIRADEQIDALGERLLARTGWSPPAE